MRFAAGALLGLAGCVEADRARRSARLSRSPADVACRGFGRPFYSGRSTGKAMYGEGGRVTTVKGERMIVYARGRLGMIVR